MKHLLAIVLSTTAICALASATPAAAQDTQDQTPSVQQSDRTQAYTASSADPANDGCHVIYGGMISLYKVAMAIAENTVNN